MFEQGNRFHGSRSRCSWRCKTCCIRPRCMTFVVAVFLVLPSILGSIFLYKMINRVVDPTPGWLPVKDSFVEPRPACQLPSNDTATWEIPPEYTFPWKKGEYPHQRHFDPKCPKYIFSSVHSFAGFGHKTSNWLSSVIAAEFLGLRALYQPFTTVGSHTADTPLDLPVWMGFEIDEYSLSEIGQHSWIRIPGMRMRSKLGWSLHEAMETLQRFNQCNVVYSIETAWTIAPSLEWAHSILSYKYLQARAKWPAPLDLYRDSEINIAFHIRLGDISPTPITWHYAAAQNILELLRSDQPACRPAQPSHKYWKLPIKFHIFTQTDDENQVALLKTLPNAVVHNKVDARSTLHHLIYSDVFISSSSQFSQTAQLAALKPLVLTPPTREVTLPFVDCHHASHLCLGHDGKLNAYHRSRVIAFRKRWVAAKAPAFLG